MTAGRRASAGRGIFLGVVLVVALSSCVDFTPDINEACDSAADRCADNLSYTECVDDALARLDEDGELALSIHGCLEDAACDSVEACLSPGD